MALIPVYHVVADFYAIDPNFSTDLVAGMAAGLSTLSGKTVAVAGDDTNVFGLAGDTASHTAAGTAYASNVVIGAAGSVAAPVGQTVSTQNRVADGFNETLASGKITVYSSGGKFKSNQFDATKTYTPGTKIYADAGQLTTVNAGSSTVVGIVSDAPVATSNGVPGVDTVDGSMSLGSYLTFKLSV